MGNIAGGKEPFTNLLRPCLSMIMSNVERITIT